MRSAKRKFELCNIKNTSGKLHLHDFMNMNSPYQSRLHLLSFILFLKSKRKQAVFNAFVTWISCRFWLVFLFFINFSNGMWLHFDSRPTRNWRLWWVPRPHRKHQRNKKQEPFDSESEVMCYSVHFLPLISLKDGKTILSLFFLALSWNRYFSLMTLHPTCNKVF